MDVQKKTQKNSVFHYCVKHNLLEMYDYLMQCVKWIESINKLKDDSTINDNNQLSLKHISKFGKENPDFNNDNINIELNIDKVKKNNKDLTMLKIDNFRNKRGYTILQYAAHRGSREMFEKILQSKMITNWKWGEASYVRFPLNEIDTFGNNQNSVLETIVADHRIGIFNIEFLFFLFVYFCFGVCLCVFVKIKK